MNTTKHTPGPWDSEPKGSQHFIDGADGLTVAYIDRAGVRERGEIEANVRLIAAAPELLAVAIAWEDATRLSDSQFYEKHGFNVAECAARRRAAITKATAS